jgi:TM2 domain-containing membrane protein YozV
MKPEKKSLWRAVMLSALIFPGAGQVYNGDRLKGYLLIALGSILSLFIILKVAIPFVNYYQAIFLDNPQKAPGLSFTEEVPGILLFLGVLAAVWIYSIIDAYWSAKDQ